MIVLFAALTALTHGNKGVIIGSDGDEVKIQDISKQFKEEELKHLRGQPKMFFFQACQGTDAQEALKLAATDNSSTTDTTSKSAMVDMKVLKLPPDSDFFYGFASSYGTLAMRLDTGSLYIQALCQVMKRYYKQDDLLTMVTRVHKEVASQKEYIYYKGKVQEYQQQPQLVSTLREMVRF